MMSPMNSSGVVTSTAPFAIDNAQVVDSLDSRLTTLKPAAGFYTSTGTHPAGAIGTWPLAPGVYNFTVRAEDSAGRFATQAQQITIGGGIFLTPLLLFFRWADLRSAEIGRAHV